MLSTFIYSFSSQSFGFFIVIIQPFHTLPPISFNPCKKFRQVIKHGGDWHKSSLILTGEKETSYSATMRSALNGQIRLIQRDQMGKILTHILYPHAQNIIKIVHAIGLGFISYYTVQIPRCIRVGGFVFCLISANHSKLLPLFV